MKTICKRCNGKGHHYAILKDLSGKQLHGCGIEVNSICDQPGCHDGIIDIEEYYKTIGQSGN